MSSAVSSAHRVGSTPVQGRELARLRALSRELASTLAEIQEASSREPGSPGARSLLRLVRGEAGPHDELMLGVTVPQSRLLAVTVPDGKRGQLLVDQLGAEGRVVALLHGDDEILCLVPDLPSRDGCSRSREAAERVAVQALRLVPSATIGISSPLQAVRELPTALDEARQVAGFGKPIVFADENWAALGVARLAEQLGSCLTMTNPLSQLMANEMLRESVRAWLEHDRNVPPAAEALAVHPNTLRYRLRRVEEVTGLSLTDPDALLLTALLLRPSGA
jgi:sugar diacid utilization regulator